MDLDRRQDPLRVLVTGSRRTTKAEDAYIRSKLNGITKGARVAGRPVIIVHGKCPTGGADLAAHWWALNTDGVEPEPHPAAWDGYGRAAGPIRNSVMVALGAHVCLAFPGPDSTGTIDCLTQAIKAGIPTQVWPLWSAGPEEDTDV